MSIRQITADEVLVALEEMDAGKYPYVEIERRESGVRIASALAENPDGSWSYARSGDHASLAAAIVALRDELRRRREGSRA